MTKGLFGIVKRKVGNDLTIKLDNGNTVKHTAKGFRFGDRVQVAMNNEAGCVREVYPEVMKQEIDFEEAM